MCGRDGSLHEGQGLSLSLDVVYFCVLQHCILLLQHTSSKGAFPDTTLASSICAVCEGEIPSNVDRASSERAYKLNCGHMCVHFLDCIC